MRDINWKHVLGWTIISLIVLGLLYLLYLVIGNQLLVFLGIFVLVLGLIGLMGWAIELLQD
jgi:hypothetical protein